MRCLLCLWYGHCVCNKSILLLFLLLSRILKVVQNFLQVCHNCLLFRVKTTHFVFERWPCSIISAQTVSIELLAASDCLPGCCVSHDSFNNQRYLVLSDLLFTWNEWNVWWLGLSGNISIYNWLRLNHVSKFFQYTCKRVRYWSRPSSWSIPVI